VSVNGYYKNFFVAYDISDMDNPVFGTDAPLGSVSARLRTNGVWRPADRLNVRLSYDFAPRVQDRLLFAMPAVTATIDPFSYRVADFDSRLYPSECHDVNSFGIFHNLDRAMVTVEADRFDIVIGRQPIAFGSARIVNPTDVLAPFSYETLDTEDRIGVDAVRLRVPMGFMGEIDAGYVFGDDFEIEQSAYYIKTRFYQYQTDVTLLALGFRENFLLGVDLARSLGGAGVWLEAAQVFAEGSSRTEKDYLRASTGFEYFFEDNTYIFAEYHFNQAGSDDPDGYLPSFLERAYTDGSVYLLGRHYVTPGIGREITPLLMASFQVLTNLSDFSMYLTPGAEYNLAENVYLSGGAFIGVGKGPQSVLEMESEFGSYPDIFYTSFRYYF